MCKFKVGDYISLYNGNRIWEIYKITEHSYCVVFVAGSLKQHWAFSNLPTTEGFTWNYKIDYVDKHYYKLDDIEVITKAL